MPKEICSHKRLTEEHKRKISESLTRPIRQRFWSKVKIDDLFGCWEWTGNKANFGYGRFSYKNKYYLAHRMSWALTYGEISKGLYVCHKCDNPICVNPSHLFLGTQKDNIADMVSKNRQSRQIGELSPSHKFNKEQILEIRAIQHESQRSIARRFGTSHVVIGKIRRRQTYFNIPEVTS